MHSQSKDPLQVDQALTARVARGDLQAFAELYERYFQGVYDFALRTSQNEQVAADVVQTAFERALVALRRGRIPQNFKAWLYTVARRLCIDEYRHSGRLVSADEADEEGAPPLPVSAVIDSQRWDPSDEYQQKELQDMVWAAAAALNPQEYSLLDLHLRRGFDTNELAAHLNLDKGTLYTRLSRLKDSLEQSLVCLFLMRQRRDTCPQLVDLLEEIQVATLTRKARKAMWEHIETCQRCHESRARLVSPLALFAALPIISAPAGLKESIWRRLEIGFNVGLSRNRGQVNLPDVLKWMAIFAVGGLATILALSALAWFTLLGGRDPVDVHSPSHDVGVPSGDSTIVIEWSPRPLAAAYAFLWSQGASDVPHVGGNLLPGMASGTTSPVLQNGAWYFHLRTQGWNGRWTSTVHLGPFIITGLVTHTPFQVVTSTATPIATQTPELQATPTHTPSVTSSPNPIQFEPKVPGPTTAAIQQQSSPTPTSSYTPTPGEMRTSQPSLPTAVIPPTVEKTTETSPHDLGPPSKTP